MIAGLSIAAWLLIAAAVGGGLIIELAFLRAHGADRDAGLMREHGRTDIDEESAS
ncbi:hypothetical protein BH23GEM9_BH23GEM9_07450 [soil metagenome]